MMKPFFFFLLFSQLAIAQTYEVHSNWYGNTHQIRELIQGEWHLSEIEMDEGYILHSDSNRIILNQNSNRKIEFSSDSIKVFPDTTLRYYTGRIRDYSYKIEYDSILSANYIKVLSGKKRKQHELESYKIVKCTQDELILESFQYLNGVLDLAVFSIYYVYRRASVDELMSELKGEWYHCSKTHKSIAFNEVDTSEIIFSRFKDYTLCSEYVHHLALDFYRAQYNNMCAVWSYNNIVGGVYEMPFSVDPKNKLLFFGRKEFIVYNILILDKEKLVLMLNRELTEFYKKDRSDK